MEVIVSVAVNLIGDDILIMRKRYDEALQMQGIPAKYQFPLMPDTNEQGETVIDSYSDPEDVYIFFDGNPKVKTLRRYGWVVENDDQLPLLIHCSFNMKHMQKDCIFTFSGQYTDLKERVFRVQDITYDIQAPDHLICKVIPVYDKQIVGRTKSEIKNTYNKSNRFISVPYDYRGNYHNTKENNREKPDPDLRNRVG